MATDKERTKKQVKKDNVDINVLDKILTAIVENDRAKHSMLIDTEANKDNILLTNEESNERIILFLITSSVTLLILTIILILLVGEKTHASIPLMNSIDSSLKLNCLSKKVSRIVALDFDMKLFSFNPESSSSETWTIDLEKASFYLGFEFRENFYVIDGNPEKHVKVISKYGRAERIPKSKRSIKLGRLSIYTRIDNFLWILIRHHYSPEGKHLT